MTITRNFAITQLLNDLRNFGLNPAEWRAVSQVKNPNRFLLKHRYDQELRLSGEVELLRLGSRLSWTWRDLQWL